MSFSMNETVTNGKWAIKEIMFSLMADNDSQKFNFFSVSQQFHCLSQKVHRNLNKKRFFCQNLFFLKFFSRSYRLKNNKNQRQIFKFLELPNTKWRVGVCGHSENANEVVSCIWRLSTHRCSSSSAPVRLHFSDVNTSSTPQSFWVQTFNEKVDNQIVITDLSWKLKFNWSLIFSEIDLSLLKHPGWPVPPFG